MGELEEGIRVLFMKYGVMKVRHAVEHECKELYASLRAIYETNEVVQEPVIEEKKVESKEQVKESKKEEKKEGYVSKSAEELKEMKAKHREAVQAKRAELEGKGIKPEDLLTKSNLEKWLQSGLSYQRIAREHVGIHENQISVVAKTFGLQSNVMQNMFGKRRGGS